MNYNISYVVYDDQNNRMETFAGPCRLANWHGLPEGWSIERFLGDTSQGMVSFADVQAHAWEFTPPLVPRPFKEDSGSVGREGSESDVIGGL